MKRLFRSPKEKVIAGVCGGIGEYLKIDPIIVRIAFVVTVAFGGAGIIGYIVAWTIVPVEGTINIKREQQGYLNPAVGTFLIIVGGALLLQRYLFPFVHNWYFGLGTWLSLSLIAVGVLFILSNREKKHLGQSENLSSAKTGEPAAEKVSNESKDESRSWKKEWDRLRRSRKERVILGICGGIGEYYSIDPVVIRLILVIIASASGGMAVLLYLLLYFLIPLENVTPAWQTVD